MPVSRVYRKRRTYGRRLDDPGVNGILDVLFPPDAQTGEPVKIGTVGVSIENETLLKVMLGFTVTTIVTAWIVNKITQK